MLVLALSAAAAASAVAAWIFDQRRCLGRNKRGKCGACGTSWAETASRDPYLIHGRLVCEACAERAKRRMPWELGALAGWAALIAMIATGNVLVGNGAVVRVLAMVAATIIVPLGAVQLMKIANRRAQRRIAAGEFPAFNALGQGLTTDAVVAPTDQPVD